MGVLEEARWTASRTLFAKLEVEMDKDMTDARIAELKGKQ